MCGRQLGRSELAPRDEAVESGLLGAIAWNVLTWSFGLPSSSSHALIGGVIGATLVSAGTSAVHGHSIVAKVLVPATLPSYVVGLRGGLGLGWMFVAAAELMGASEGLGFLLIYGQMTGRPALVIASLIAFAVVGKATDLVIVLAGRRVLAWQDTVEAQGNA